MRKIPTIFVRGDNGKITMETHPDCAWVFAGEGVATEKLDGTNVRLTVRAGQVIRTEKRRNPTKAQKKEDIVDPWYVEVMTRTEERWILAAVVGTNVVLWPDGEHCCEALGPKIQGNPLQLEGYVCVPFDLTSYNRGMPNLGAPVLSGSARHFEGLQVWFSVATSVYSPGQPMEGIVFHHPDGRRAKIKRKDFV